MKKRMLASHFCASIGGDGRCYCSDQFHYSGLFYRDELVAMKDAIEKTLNDYEELGVSDDYVDEKDNLAMEKYMNENRGSLLSRGKTQKDDDLYLIYDKEANLLKIGRSANVESRLKQLQTANGHKLVLLCVIKKRGNTEDCLHEKFSLHNTNGEWFKYSEDIINEFKSLGGIINKNGDAQQDADFVEQMYKLYPTRCPVRNTTLGKSHKDKERIKRLLKTYSQEDIERVIRHEVDEKYGKSYMSNFSTFLNNFPDPSELFSSKSYGYPQSVEDMKDDDVQTKLDFFNYWIEKKAPNVCDGLSKGRPQTEPQYQSLIEHTEGGARALCYVVLVLNRDGWEQYADERGFMWVYSNYIKANGLYKG